MMFEKRKNVFYELKFVFFIYSFNKVKEWFQLEDFNRDGLVFRDELFIIVMNIGMIFKQVVEIVDLFYMIGDINGDGKFNWKGI